MKHFFTDNPTSKLVFRCLIGAGVLLCLPLFTGRAQSAQEILDHLRKSYESFRDVQIKFTQHIAFAVAKVEQRASGTLEFKKDHKYRIELEDQVIVTDGETVWSYSASSNQVLIDHYVQDEHQVSPERILTAAPHDFSATLIGKEKIGTRDVFVLKLVPKTEQIGIKSMKLWVDDDEWMIRKVEIVDFNGTETTYAASDIKLDTGVENSRFSFRIPDGASVVDLR